MPNAKTQIDQEYDGPVNVMLTGGRVTSSFRQALFLAAGRSGMTVNEFALRAAGEKLAKRVTRERKRQGHEPGPYSTLGLFRQLQGHIIPVEPQSSPQWKLHHDPSAENRRRCSRCLRPPPVPFILR